MQDEHEFSELVERIQRLTSLGPREAFKIADQLVDQHGYAPSPVQIMDAASALGYDVEHPEPDARDQAPENAEPMPEVTTNPVEVLAAMYREMPRVLAHNMPKIGRVPKASVFYDEEVQAMLAALPEHLRVLIGNIDLLNGQLTVTLYDEANDLDRTIGPIELERFLTDEQGGEKLNTAIETLIKRLPVVLASDYN